MRVVLAPRRRQYVLGRRMFIARAFFPFFPAPVSLKRCHLYAFRGGGSLTISYMRPKARKQDLSNGRSTLTLGRVKARAQLQHRGPASTFWGGGVLKAFLFCV